MKFVRAVLVVSAEALPVKASEPYPVYSQLSTDTVTSTAEYLFKGIHSRGHSFQHYSGRPHDFSQERSYCGRGRMIYLSIS